MKTNLSTSHFLILGTGANSGPIARTGTADGVAGTCAGRRTHTSQTCFPLVFGILGVWEEKNLRN